MGESEGNEGTRISPDLFYGAICKLEDAMDESFSVMASSKKGENRKVYSFEKRIRILHDISNGRLEIGSKESEEEIEIVAKKLGLS
jgi:hypothetical protein